MEEIYDPSRTNALYARYRGFDLVIDSRRVTRPDETLFFALPGRTAHGADFIEALSTRGVRHFVVPSNKANLALSQVQGLDETHRVTLAQDPINVLQDLAAYHRKQFPDIPVIGITGSNGKTIVKDWLHQLLQTKFQVCASPRSFNSQIGVPLSVWQLGPEHDIAIFEAGISRVGEMAKLARIIQPTIGLFTNLGSAHDDGFPSREEKLVEKMLLFATCQFIAVAAGNVAVRNKIPPALHLVYTGEGRQKLIVDGVAIAIDLPELPQIYLENAYAALALAYWHGLTRKEVAKESAKLLPLENRLEQTYGLHGGPVINDSYSNDFDALAAAIQYAGGQSPTGKIQLILGALQPGALSNPLRTRGGALLNEERIETLILVGNQQLEGLGQTKIIRFATVEDLLRGLNDLAFSPLPILVKGASYERMGRVARALSQHQHRTNLRIDLGAIQHNFRVYRDRAHAKMIVMVKASAYGGGSLPIARAMQEAGADYLAVAYTDEGRELRRGGIELPIMVLNPEPGEFEELLDWRLEPVIASVNTLRRAGELGLPVHWELDTGMARLGMEAKDAYEQLTLTPKLPEIKSVFSHLVASDAPEHDAFTREQFELFDRESRKIAERLGYEPMRHLLNSNGIARWPELQLDGVRLGIGLYGIGDATLKDQLRPALRLTTRISLIKRQAAGTSIGYNRAAILHRESLVATLSIGYADGLPRLAGNGNFSVSIHGRPAPTVGAVCMDMTMVDVTDHEPHQLREGMEVVIFGPELPIEELAAAAQTIPYEILTGIGQRVHRIYVRE